MTNISHPNLYNVFEYEICEITLRKFLILISQDVTNIKYLMIAPSFFFVSNIKPSSDDDKHYAKYLL